jgi:NAD(P)-dependent dehydrogenase (short-subunit alcohol dehydrogenase family)
LTTPPFGVNLAGFFWLTQRAIAEMVSRYGGHVVNVSATIAEVANSGTPLVLAALTKGGLAAATRSLAVGYGSRGIVVNAWHPALSRPRCTRRTATEGPAAGFPRSAGPAR